MEIWITDCGIEASCQAMPVTEGFLLSQAAEEQQVRKGFHAELLAVASLFLVALLIPCL